jgi:hypothetical protein
VSQVDYAEDDAEWFIAHPNRNYRVRRTIDGEWPPGAALTWTAIWQVAPGMRIRAPFDVNQEGERRMLLYAAGDAGAKTVFEHVSDPKAVKRMADKFKHADKLRRQAEGA